MAVKKGQKAAIRRQFGEYLDKSKKIFDHSVLSHLVPEEILLDLSFFNFQNAITACFYTDRNFTVRKVNENFRAFFKGEDQPLIGQDLTRLFTKLGMEDKVIENFCEQFSNQGWAKISQINIAWKNEATFYSLFSTHTDFRNLGSLSGIQGQFMDITQEILLRKQADNLLHAILPLSIAEELKSSGKVRPKRHENVAILIGDVVGFTPYSESHLPEQVIAELQRISDHFETITEKYQLDKINAVGDSFMAVVGLEAISGNTVLQCVKCGLELHSALENLPSGLKFRIGVHVGPVVAGVVGKKKFLYGLFGDTVNTAARMESNGRPGIVCLSAEAWEMVSDVCVGKSQGTVSVKGKGDMEIFHVESVSG